MKTYKALLVFLILLVNCSTKDNVDITSDWTLINSPILSGKSLTDVEFLNDNFGLISAERGILVKTIDGGLTWTNLNVGTNHSFLKTFILNENEFFTSRNKIYKTINKGESFNTLGGFSDNGGSISGIYFFDSNNGVINKGSNLYKTYDGGQTWNLVYNQAEFANKILFASSNVGFFYGGKTDDNDSVGELYKTVDAGNNWEKLNVSTSQITSMYFLNEHIGYASNYDNQVLKTKDGGINWEIIENQNQPFYDLIFLDNEIGYGISSNVIFITKDGGLSWTIDYETVSMTFTSITRTPNNKIVVVTNNGNIFIKEHNS